MTKDDQPSAPQEQPFVAFKKVSSFKTFSLIPRSLPGFNNHSAAVVSSPRAPEEGHHSATNVPQAASASTCIGKARITAKDDDAQEDVTMEDAPAPECSFTASNNEGKGSVAAAVPESMTEAHTEINHLSSIDTRRPSQLSASQDGWWQLTGSTAGAGSSNRASKIRTMLNDLENSAPSVNAARSSGSRESRSLSIDDGTQRSGISGLGESRQTRASELEDARKRAMVAGFLKRAGNWINPRAQYANESRLKAEDWF
ncbi:MAG: hypothetical protein M1835_002510 [Candelina submexicana]|nr:MAG: hypothetical protein M1835_002510 [Candelina submexicana]